jgi:enterochelin esterase-like enzyme
MGGYGTLYYAVKHPEMFCCAYAMSPATYISETTPNLFELYPAANAAELPELTIEVGTEDATVYESCAAFNAWVLAGIPSIEYIERSGVHDWAFWKGCYPKFLTKLGKYFE